EPVTHTYVTINGDVSAPRTLRVPVGISFRELIKFCGNNLSESTHLLIEGGPLMGKVITDWDLPVVKTTKGLIVASKNSYLAQRYTNLSREIGKNVVSICCDCQQCTELCPRYLLGHSIEPHRLMVAVAQGINREAKIFRQAQFCCECGVCELYSCFMNLAPRSLNAEIKRELSKRGIKSQPFKEQFSVHPLRAARLLPTKRIKARLDISRWERAIIKFEEFPETEIRKLVLPLRQHIGAICKPVVKRRDKVKKGMVVAEVAPANLGVPLHSPVNGVITEINDDKIVIQVRNN
ncbi:MAG: 4Fe-4S dicluster domain-containing protein, partial [Candidatus Sumerlaeia bacterium]|nr:4Fe-4S dicluster domain-containing protein [Candidatus Sumerlaeia bacterium]